jgi:hypothetical protein
VLVTAHYPFYETYDDLNEANLATERSKPDHGARGVHSHSSMNSNARDRARGSHGNRSGSHARSSSSSRTLPVPSKAQAVLDLEPMLAEFGIDFYFAGHDHNYETTWPVYVTHQRTKLCGDVKFSTRH